MKNFIAFIFAAVLTAGAWALETSDGWKYSVNNGEITITGHANPVSNLSIPSAIDQLPVVSIGAGAFAECTMLSSVYIPSSIDTIGDNAFKGCASLASVLAENGDVDRIKGLMRDKGVDVDQLEFVRVIGPQCIYNVICNLNVAEGKVDVYVSISGFTNGFSDVDCVFTAINAATGDAISIERIERTGEDVGRASTWTRHFVWDAKTDVGRVKIDDLSITVAIKQKNVEEVISSSTTNIMLDLSVLPDGGPYKETVDGVEYTFTISNGEATIGTGGYSAAISTSTSGALVIPSTLGGCPVTSIGSYGFYWCSSLTSVTIPDSVTTIGSYAFSDYCYSLTSVTIPDSVTTIGNYAFYNCSSLKEVHIKDLAKWCDISFDNDAANPCCYAHHLYLNGEEIRDLVIPDGVTTIGAYAFSDCSSLASITIPDSVTTIGAAAFWGCSSLTSVTIPDGVTTIGVDAFSNCSSLASITIPDSVTTIGEWAFICCSSLKEVHITDLAKWCEISFGPYANPCCYAHHLYLNGEEIRDLVIPDGVTTIGEFAFYECSSLTSVTIPDSVTTIGEFAFYECSSLTSVTIPDSVTTIGSRAFSGTPFYNNQPDGLVVLGNGCLYKYKGTCSSSVTVPNTVATICDYAFYNCSSLTSVTIPDGVTTIGDSAFRGCSSLTSVTIGNRVTTIEYYAFSNCSSLTSVKIPDGVTTIDSYAFSGCSSLKTIYVDYGDENRVRELLQGKGVSVSDLTFVQGSLPDGGPYKETVDGVEFTFCTSNGEAVIETEDSSAAIPTSTSGKLVVPTALGGCPVTTIGSNAFEGCSSLAAITISDSVNAIGECALSGCINAEIVFEGSCPSGYLESGILDCKNVRIPEGDETYPEMWGGSYWQFECSAPLIIHTNDGDMTQWTGSFNSSRYSGCPDWVRFVIQTVDGEIIHLKDEEYSYLKESSALGSWDQFIVRVKGDYHGGLIAAGHPALRGCYPSYDDEYTSWWREYVNREGDLSSLADCRCGNVVELHGDDSWGTDDRESWISASWLGYPAGEYAQFLNGVYYYQIPAAPDPIYYPYGEYYRFVFDYLGTEYVAKPQRDSYAVKYDLGNASLGNQEPLTIRYSLDSDKITVDPFVEDWFTFDIDYGNEMSGCAGWDIKDGWRFVGWRIVAGKVTYISDGRTKEAQIGQVFETIRGFSVVCDENDALYEGPVASFEAVYEPVSYDITYEGFPAFVWGYDLPTSYTYGQECQLPKIENPGADFDYQFGSSYFRFEGWTINGEMVEGIPIGTSGDVTVRFNGKELINLGAEGADSPEEIEPGRYCKVFSYDCFVAWNGEPSTPKVSVTVDRGSGSLELVEGQDFTVEYVDNDKVGTAKVIVRGKGDYIGTYTGSFTITKGSMTVDGDPESAPNQFLWQWTGLNYFPCPGEEGWTCDFDYDGTEKSVWIFTNDNADIVDIAITGVTNAVNAGVYTARAKGSITRYATDDYYNYTYVTPIDSTMTMTIKPRDLSGFAVELSGDVFFIDGAVRTPSVIVRDDGLEKTLVRGVDFDVEYSPIAIGEQTVTVVGKGNYKGTITRQFTILDRLENLPKPVIKPESKISGASVAIVINYAKMAGYETEIRYTIGGDDPTATSLLYTGKFNLPIVADTTIRAAAFLRGVRVSEIVSQRYMPTLESVIVSSGEGYGPVSIVTSGANAWTLDINECGYDGTPTMRSGRIGDDGVSEMSATFSGDGVFEFWWKTSCEHDTSNACNWDRVECYLDGKEVARKDGVSEWTQVTNVVEKGEHIILWRYQKDEADEDPYLGEDCAWVDGVKFSFAAYIDFAADEEIVGELPTRIVSAAGYSVALPEIGDVSYEKHVFSGWQYNGKVYQPGELLLVDRQEMTVKPTWTEVLEVAYNLNGGEGSAPEKQYAVLGNSIKLNDIGAANMAKHSFGGWSLGEDKYATGDEFTPAEDVIFVAIWVPKTLAAPVIDVIAEHDDPSTIVTISHETATIYYTIDGTEPSEANGTRYEAPFEVSGSATIKAIAIKDDYFDSEVVEATVVSTYTPMSVGFVGGEGVIGTMPSAIETALRREIELPEIGEARLPKHTFGGWSDGFAIYQPGSTYSITGEVEFAAVWEAKVLPDPTIKVAEWYDTEKTEVEIECENEEATIYYTLDGTEPNADSTKYEGRFEVEGSLTIKAISIAEDWFDSEVVEKSTVRAPWTIEECLNATNLAFVCEGDADWARDLTESHDGSASMKSGAIGNKKSSTIKTTVQGAGTLTFYAKVSSEADAADGEAYDGLMVYVGEAQCWNGLVGGETGWQYYEIKINTPGNHTITWSYEKDKSGSAGDDCAWIDMVTWTPAATRPSALEHVAEKIKEAFDEWVKKHGVSNPSAANVNAFILGLTPDATEEEIQEQVEAEIENIDMSKLATDPAAAVEVIQAKYPNAKVELAPVKDIKTSAHLYKLIIDLK